MRTHLEQCPVSSHYVRGTRGNSGFKKFIVIDVHEFTDTPIICKADANSSLTLSRTHRRWNGFGAKPGPRPY